MATKKGSRVNKSSSVTLLLETRDPIAETWITFTVADREDEDQVKHIMDLAEKCEKSEMRYRLIDRTVTIRTQITETVVQGEGKEPTPVAGMT